MKRSLAFLLVLILALSASGISGAEESDSSVYSFDFDLRLHLNAEGFQPRIRSHIRGYSDLLDMLSLEGNLTWSAETESFDLQLDIIPLDNPSAGLSMRFFGIPEHVCMSSSLLGDETIWFNSYVLMEFALKSWNNLHMPLQYLALLFPYVTQNAFQRLLSDWTGTIGTVTKSQKIPLDKLKKVSSLWTNTLQEDQRLIYWITGLSVLSEDHMILENEINSLPEYLISTVSGNHDLTVRADNDKLEWLNHSGHVLYGSVQNGSSWSFSLPATGNGYKPDLAYSSESAGGFSDISVKGSYRRDGLEYAVDEDVAELPDSLLDFCLDVRSVPETWPVESYFTAGFDVAGSVFPNFDIRIQGETKENGEFILSVYDQENSAAGTESILSCTGKVIPVEPASVPAYSVSELTKHLSVFSVNDKTVSEFSQKIRRPLITGILNFLDEVPASACQSVMDDLEEYGLLNLLLEEE